MSTSSLPTIHDRGGMCLIGSFRAHVSSSECAAGGVASVSMTDMLFSHLTASGAPAKVARTMNGDPTQFEEPILRIRRQIEDLSALDTEPARQAEIAELQQQLTKVSHEIYSNLTPWQKTLVSRHA